MLTLFSLLFVSFKTYFSQIFTSKNVVFEFYWAFYLHKPSPFYLGTYKNAPYCYQSKSDYIQSENFYLGKTE